MAEIHPIKTAAEIALAEAYGAVRDRLPGTDETRSCATGLSRPSRGRAAAPARRGVEIHRPARPDARGRAACAGPERIALDKARHPSRGAGRACPSAPDAGRRQLRAVPVRCRRLPAAGCASSLVAGAGRGDPSSSTSSARSPPTTRRCQLNAAFMTDGVVLARRSGRRACNCRSLLQSFIRAMRSRRLYAQLIVLGEGASMTLVDCYEGADGAANQTNAAIEVHLAPAPGSTGRVQAESLASLHLSSLMVSLGKAASFHSFALTAGAAVARNQLFVTYAGEGAKAQISGATMLAGARTPTRRWWSTMPCRAARAASCSRACSTANSSGLPGQDHRPADAQKTDGRMMSRALLLSRRRRVDTKPELEIFADDVQCGHGATCGQLDEDLLFYCARAAFRKRRPKRSCPGLSWARRSRRSGRGAARGRCRTWPRAGLRRIGCLERRPGSARRPHMTGAMTKGTIMQADRRRLRRRARSAPISRSSSQRSTASRWSISTTAPRPRSRGAVIEAMTTPTRTNTPTSIAACTSSPTPRPRPMRPRARRCARFLNAAHRSRRSSSRARPTEAINLVAASLRAAAHRRGRRDRPLDHGAPLQHRALALPARAQAAP